MQKIISSILIIVGIASVHSCREQDEDLPTDMQIESKQSSDSEMHKDGDSVPKITDAEFTEYDGTTDDPPPKDTGQWKAAKKQ